MRVSPNGDSNLLPSSGYFMVAVSFLTILRQSLKQIKKIRITVFTYFVDIGHFYVTYQL